MAWTTPPTFTNSLLSAANLNILSDDLEHLYGLLQMTRPPFRALTLNLEYSNNLWYIRYRERYLHYKVTVVGGDGNSAIALYVNGVSRWSDATARAQNYVYSGYLDMNSYGLTAGQLYSVYFTFTFPTYNSGVRVDKLLTSGSTTS